jgi:hypothetical protein
VIKPVGLREGRGDEIQLEPLARQLRSRQAGGSGLTTKIINLAARQTERRMKSGLSLPWLSAALIETSLQAGVKKERVSTIGFDPIHHS